MDEKRLQQLLNNDEFIEKILTAATVDEMQLLFSSHGRKVSEKEIQMIIDSLEKAIEDTPIVISENNNIAGGTDINKTTNTTLLPLMPGITTSECENIRESLLNQNTKN